MRLHFELFKLLKIPNSKRSQGHIEMVLSFVLFVGFLIFIFMFINPLIRVEEKLTIEKEKNAIMNLISDDVGKIPVVVEEGYCYSLDEVKRYGDKFIEKYERTFLKDSITYHRYTLYFFGEIPGTSKCSGDPVDSSKYKIGKYTEETFVIKSKIDGTDKLKTRYDTGGYNALKNELDIGDFSFSIRDLNGIEDPGISVNKEIPKGVNVVSIDIPIKFLDDSDSSYVDSDFKELILNIKKW